MLMTTKPVIDQMTRLSAASLNEVKRHIQALLVTSGSTLLINELMVKAMRLMAM